MTLSRKITPELIARALMILSKGSGGLAGRINLFILDEQLGIDYDTRAHIVYEMMKMGLLKQVDVSSTIGQLTGKARSVVHLNSILFKGAEGMSINISDGHGIAVATGEGAVDQVDINHALEVLDQAIEQADVSDETKANLKKDFRAWLKSARDAGVGVFAGLTTKRLGG